MDSPAHPPAGLQLTDLRSVFYFTRFAGQAGFAPWAKYRPPSGRQLFHPLQKTQPSAIADEAHPWRGGPHLRTTQYHHSPLPPLLFCSHSVYGWVSCSCIILLLLFIHLYLRLGELWLFYFHYFFSFICIYGWVNCGCFTSTILFTHSYLRLGELYLVYWGSKAFIPYKIFHYFTFYGIVR